jgi:hypothetical protein
MDAVAGLVLADGGGQEFQGLAPAVQPVLKRHAHAVGVGGHGVERRLQRRFGHVGCALLAEVQVFMYYKTRNAQHGAL